MDDLLSEFLTECFENLAVLDVELVNLEQRPNDPELLGSIFRIVHTIKGTCGFLGLPRLEKLAHAGENVLGKFRDGEITVCPNSVTLILQALDQIKFILDQLEATEAEPPGDDADLIARLDATADGKGVPQMDAVAAADKPDLATDAEIEDQAEAAADPFATDDEDEVQTATAFEAATVVEAEVVEAEAVVEAPVAKAAASESDAAKAAQKSQGASVANQSLRVPVDLLEDLMTLVSELVLTRNQLLQMVRNAGETQFKAPLQRLSHITSELQEGVMKTRMQPIGNAWAKLPRLIRDLCVDLDKQIELRMLGADTELDRQVLELIKDPLTHMVRNSADHGIETPAVRRQSGKPESGTITLNAFHQGGQIIIEIADDGRGLDVVQIGKKAVQNKLITEDELASMTPQQIFHYIFAPGFSTAVAVTNVSGRGVGMDVVRTNIEKIGGSIDLSSEPGRGTRLMIKIPLTLAIVPALIVEAGSERFAIPQIGVVELVRAGLDAEHRIEIIDGSPILRLRDRLLPLVRLTGLLGLDSPESAPSFNNVCVVVSQVGNNSFGLVVDQVFDTEEIVVKPVSPLLRGVGCFSGNTILGDGSVVMILDLNDLVGDVKSARAEAAANASKKQALAHERTAVLLFRAAGETPRAVPLGLITRLEEIDLDMVEAACGRSVIQYRDDLMPLTDLHGSSVITGEGRRPVLVFTDGGRNMGLVVDEIIDIADDRIEIKSSNGGAGIVGSAVIAGRTTDVIDVAHYVQNIFGGWFADVEVEAFSSDGPAQRRVLLVDDSTFFRNLLTPILTANHFEVETSDCPAAALARRDRGETFDIVISDIEMPGMDGFGFVSEVRCDGAWKDIPVIALTSHTTNRDIERGHDVGFSDYVGKLDREALLSAINETLQHRRAYR